MLKRIPLSPFFIHCILVLALAFQGAAFAEVNLTGTYTGLQFAEAEYDLNTDAGNRLSDSWGYIKAKYGKQINEYFALEGQLGLVTKTDSDQGVVTYGGYARFSKDFGRYKPYALLGFAGMELYDKIEDNQSETGFSYGAGIELFGSKDLTLSIEYVSLLNQSTDTGELTYKSLGIGFTYYFSEDTSQFNKNTNKVRSIRY